jgi:hypothetical protein
LCPLGHPFFKALESSGSDNKYKHFSFVIAEKDEKMVLFLSGGDHAATYEGGDVHVAGGIAMIEGSVFLTNQTGKYTTQTIKNSHFLEKTADRVITSEKVISTPNTHEEGNVTLVRYGAYKPSDKTGFKDPDFAKKFSLQIHQLAGAVSGFPLFEEMFQTEKQKEASFNLMSYFSDAASNPETRNKNFTTNPNENNLSLNKELIKLAHENLHKLDLLAGCVFLEEQSSALESLELELFTELAGRIKIFGQFLAEHD